MRSSLAAFNLIVAEEVSSQAIYNKKYRRPEWPGESSGATIGIGYDLGQTAKATVKQDWSGRVPSAMLSAMLSACGRTGAAGREAMREIYNRVEIPWEVAIAVHKECVIPRWEAKVLAALPNADKLHPDCFGALLSLTFNRGPSFGMKGDRYREMRAIKQHMANEDYDKIPDELRAMKRIWPNLVGLRRRRDNEAALFERGVAAMDAAAERKEPAGPVETDVPSPDFKPQPILSNHDSEEPVENETRSLEARAPDKVPDKTVVFVQTRLRELGYFEVGEADGGVNGMARTEASILAFRNDNDLPLSTAIDDELLRTLVSAPHRPVSEARANATVSDLREKGSKTVGIMDRMKLWASGMFAAGGAGAVGVNGDTVDAITDGAGKVSSLKSTLNDLGINMGTVVVLILVAVAVFYFAHKAQKNRLEEYQMGKNT